MKREDIKEGMVLWSICGGKPFMEGVVTGVNERFLADGVQVFFDTGDYSFSDRLYPSEEAAQRVASLAHTPWRTDFENMPKDGDSCLNTQSVLLAMCDKTEEVTYWSPERDGWIDSDGYQIDMDLAVCWMPIPDYSMFLEVPK